MKTKWIWIIVAAVVTCVVALLGIFKFDVPVYNFLVGFGWPGLKVFGQIFSPKNWLAISLILVVIFYVRKIIQTKSKLSVHDMYAKIRGSYAFWVFCSVFCAELIGLVIKFVVGRARPGFSPEFVWFTNQYEFHSMPSGHALAAFAGLVMIGMIAPRGRWAAWALAAALGVSRVCVGAHWPSDVIVGAFIGTVSAIVVKDVLSKRIK